MPAQAVQSQSKLNLQVGTITVVLLRVLIRTFSSQQHGYLLLRLIGKRSVQNMNERPFSVLPLLEETGRNPLEGNTSNYELYSRRNISHIGGRKNYRASALSFT